MCNLSDGIYEDGINHGITKGKIEDAIEMLKDGVPFDKIAKYTKLSLQVIEDVAKKNKLF